VLELPGDKGPLRVRPARLPPARNPVRGYAAGAASDVEGKPMMLASGQVQWGDVASWVAGLATAGAFVVTYLLLRLTLREQREQRQERTLEQARHVSVWTEVTDFGDKMIPDVVTVTLRNSGREPIYSTRVAVGADWWSDPKTRYVEVKNVPEVFPPDSREGYQVEIHVGRTRGGDPELRPPAEVIFCDSEGRWYCRDRFGGLREITEELPPSGSAHFFKPPLHTIGGGSRRRRGRDRPHQLPQAVLGGLVQLLPHHPGSKETVKIAAVDR
jgi:hypothetical protein